MRRREFLKIFVCAAGATSLAARAQQVEGVRKLGVLMARKIDDAEGQKQFAALRRGLSELGWLEGQNIQIEARWTVGDPAKALKFARELVGLRPDALVANGTPSLVAIREATTAIPTVFGAVADPVGQGFVPSLSRPGGNITGFGVEEASMGGKWLELLKELAPAVTRVFVSYNPDTAPYGPMFFPAMQAAAPNMNVTLSISQVRTSADVERVFVEAAREPNSGLIVLPDSFMFSLYDHIVALSAKHRLPAVYPIRFFATGGGLAAYGIDRVDLFRRAANYVDRIFRGGSAAELPVQQPTKFEFVINLRAARELGLKVPQTLLFSADEVIE